MAGNEWLTGYLDAILDTGPALGERQKTDENTDRDAAARYFIREVKEFTGSREQDLHRTWLKATALKNSQERATRVENFCWRIWHLTRRKKEMQWEEAQRLARRRVEREEADRDASEDMPEDLMEDSDKSEVHHDSPAAKSTSDGVANEGKPTEEHQDRRLYVVMISLHGLVRGENMELGRDSDTGGQIKYVVEFARALASTPQVYRVDLLTRQILSPEVDWSYGEPTEMLATMGDESQGSGESAGAYIVRIPCGPRDQYIRKELLWPYVPEFVDGALAHVVHMSKVLGDQIGGGQPVWPHMVHGHYADAGDIASLLSGALNVPMVLTGHSLGRNKLEQLLKQGRRPDDIDATYKIMRRIEAEEFSLDAAELVITSTRQEIDQQWGLYDGFDVKLERVLRARMKRGVSCHGRYMPRMVVVPPGMDFSNVIAEAALDTGTDSPRGDVPSPSTRPEPSIWTEVMRFFTNPRKPIILALARPDPKKNLVTLVKAYGECKPLRDIANLVLIMGNRDDIDEMSGGNAEVLTTVLKLIDRYDMYGQVAYPKHHKQNEVPEIYRLAAESKGVFVNPALVEPFGLTLIEAAAHGLPMVATKNGGPVDIQRVLSNGVLVDPHDQQGIAEALLKLVSDRDTWDEYRKSGLRNIHLYSWPGHCRAYLSRVAMCRLRHPQWRGDAILDASAETDSNNDSLRDVRDLSLGLSVDGKGLGNNSLTSGADLERLLAEREQAAQQPPLSRRAAGQRSTGLQPMQEDGEPHGLSHQAASSMAAGSTLRKRKGLVVVAVDSYESSGELGPGFVATVKWVVGAVGNGRLGEGVGVALATAMTGSEVVKLLKGAGIGLDPVDVIIAGSGSEVYYVAGGQPVLDTDYEGHIEYRWGGDGLRKSMARVIAAAREGAEPPSSQPSPVVEDPHRCGPRRLAYRVTDPDEAPSTKELRKRLRMRGLRCHVVYCRAGTSLYLLPLHASRAQALRYLFVRWGVDVAKMSLLVGPAGDGDHLELISGTHRTIIVGAPSCAPSDPAKALMTTTEGDVTAAAPNVKKLDVEKGLAALDSAWDDLKLH